MKRKEQTVVLSFRKPKSFVERFDACAQSAGMDRVDFLEALVNNFQPVACVVSTAEAVVEDPNFLGAALRNRFPELRPKSKHKESIAGLTEMEKEEVIKLAKRRKRRGLNYDERLEEYL